MVNFFRWFMADFPISRSAVFRFQPLVASFFEADNDAMKKTVVGLAMRLISRPTLRPAETDAGICHARIQLGGSSAGAADAIAGPGTRFLELLRSDTIRGD
jgi:hypothetical protein